LLWGPDGQFDLDLARLDAVDGDAPAVVAGRLLLVDVAELLDVHRRLARRVRHRRRDAEVEEAPRAVDVDEVRRADDPRVPVRAVVELVDGLAPELEVDARDPALDWRPNRDR
jgi:hypothetical protein